MDCNHARLLLIFSRKRSELDATEAEALDGHLKQCAQCAGAAEAERDLDEAVGKAMGNVPVPEGLQGRLLAGLERERGIRVWRRGLTAASLAAGLLLAVGMAWFFWLGARTTPNYPDFEEESAAKVAAAPEAVEQWFSNRGMAMEFPRQLNHGLLISYDSAHFLNRLVPKLVFFYRGGDRDHPTPMVADVYVLSAKQFRLDQVPQQMPGSMELLTENPNFHYLVVIHPRGSLQPFLNKGGPQG